MHSVDDPNHSDINRLLSIQALLTSPLAASILKIHPNDLCTTGDWDSDAIAPNEWNGWWHWAANDDGNDNGEDEKWIKLVRFYNEHSSGRISNNPSDVPSDLRDLMAKIKSLQLDRTPHLHHMDVGLKHLTLAEIVSRGSGRRSYGMSPKKTHEVTHMLAYISRLLTSMPVSITQRGSMKHIVDVGAGQGYLTRGLASLNPCPPSNRDFDNTSAKHWRQPNETRSEKGMQILALDSDHAQTSGAERWERKVRKLEGRKRKGGNITADISVNTDTVIGTDIGSSAAERPWNDEDGKRDALAEAEPAEEERAGRITHKTIHITPSTLLFSIDEWISGVSCSGSSKSDFKSPRGSNVGSQAPTPVLLVALHACGSLSPSIIRAFLSAHRERQQSHQTRDQERPVDEQTTRGWIPAGLVLVGCCYNLLEMGDFPLSRVLRPSPSSPSFSPASKPNLLPSPLPSSYLHLASQIPSTWLISANLPSVRLSIRKVVWRALIGVLITKSKLQDQSQRVVPTTNSHHQEDIQWTGSDNDRRRRIIYPPKKEIKAGSGETPIHRRLGKINDGAYENWKVFLRIAGEKMGVDLSRSGLGETEQPSPNSTPPFTPTREENTREPTKPTKSKRRQTESRLAVLHTLRCLLGPLVECMILLDRLIWIREELADMAGGVGSEMDVQLVNLFDQTTGSGRNVGIIVKPSKGLIDA